MVKKLKNTTVAILDIGSSKIVCFIAKIWPFSRIEITGIGHNVSQGIKAGRITDIKSAENAIAQAVESAEQMAGETVKNIYVSISSSNLISQCMASDLMVTGREINEKDISRLLFQVLDKFNEKELDVIHTFAYDHMLDGNRGIENPLGMYGNKLAIDYHILSAPSNLLLNINNCMRRCQLEIENFVSASYASGLACLTDDEKNLGVILMEFGGSTTSVSIFHKGHMLFTDAIPIGGMHITNDIAMGFCTDFNNAERIKTLYGTVIMTSADYDEMIEVPISSSQSEVEINTVKRSMLVEIIRARVEEILDIVQKKLEESNMIKYGGNKIVITGGTAKLSGMKEMVSHVFSKTVRVGYPKEISGLADSTSGIAFSTPVGMLFHLAKFENTNKSLIQSAANDTSPLSNVWQWFKENFG